MATEGLDKIMKEMEGLVSRIKRDINRFQDELEAGTLIEYKQFPSLSSPDYMQQVATVLDDTSNKTYEIGVLVSTLNRVRQKLKEIVRTNGQYQLAPSYRRMDEELGTWADTYRSVSFNLVERSRALRSLLSAGSQER